MSQISKSEERIIEEQLRIRLSTAITSYNRFITPSSSDKKKEEYMPDGDRILHDIRQERDLKIFHFSDKFYDDLQVIIETQMKDLINKNE